MGRATKASRRRIWVSGFDSGFVSLNFSHAGSRYEKTKLGSWFASSQSLEKESATRTVQQQELTETLKRQDEHSTERQQELLQTLQTTAETTQQQLKSLTRIDEQITMLLKNEVDNIVKTKVQEIFTNLIRREADRRIDERLKV